MGIVTLKEELILSALMIRGGSSGGSPLRKMVSELSQRDIVYGTLYNLLENCIRKGYVTSSQSDPLPVPGGRRKTIYTITDEGEKALRETLAMHDQIRRRLPIPEFEG